MQGKTARRLSFAVGAVAIGLMIVSTASALHDAGSRDGGWLLRRPNHDAAIEPPDAAPPTLPMKVKIENLSEFPKHVIFLYPTIIGSFGVRFEAGKSYTKILRTKENGGSFLHAVPKVVYDRLAPKPRVRPVADEAASAEVFGPPFESLRSKESIVVPTEIEGVALASVERVYVIKKLTDSAFELELKSDDAILKDGSRVSMAAIMADAAAHKPPPPPPRSSTPPPPPLPPPAPSAAAPSSGSCQTVRPGTDNASPGTALSPLALALALLVARRRATKSEEYLP